MFRPVAVADVEEAVALVAEAFVGYRAFAPADWEPPAVDAQVRGLVGWAADPDYWGELARDDAGLVGFASVVPAVRATSRPASDAAVAHLGHLFVTPGYWGSGVAAQLLARARAAALGRGFASMRLFVPVGQARARRFYAREGFTAAGEPFDFASGLPVLEYRSPLEP